MLDPDSADLTLLQDRQVAILGYDAVAAAHALNLRDSGVDVWVGVAPDSRLADRAETEGLAVSPPEEAAQRCDIILVPVADKAGGGPGEDGVAAYQRLIDEHTDPGDLVVVTDGAIVAVGGLTVPEGVDLAMLSTIGDGDRVREEYLDGRGSPALVAVQRDSSGAAWATLTAYAAAMGSLRSGAIVTTLDHQAQAMAYADDHVHRPLQQMVVAAFDELVARGIEEEVAYLAVVHELRARVDQLGTTGLTPERGPAAHPIDQVGRRVRALMSWIR